MGGAEDEDRGGDTGPAQLFPFIDADDAESPGAGIERRAADRDRPVAVGIRLHHGENARGRGAVDEEAGVVGDGVEVDLGPHGAPLPFGREHAGMVPGG